MKQNYLRVSPQRFGTENFEGRLVKELHTTVTTVRTMLELVTHITKSLIPLSHPNLTNPGFLMKILVNGKLQ